ncbi:YDG/SRA domain-containing protein [Nonomuraea maheshkhaliensis]|uniref:YDG/SRA domain-containing protein n=1 Tax=Nonomuraea maheshkhaliensis TaxID=419590 RepID=A0ABP4R638_9ACTN
MAYIRTFGEIPGNSEGTLYVDREELRLAGLHAHKQNGISGTEAEGADAIVLNGGYPDDWDEGDLIIYTGQGGQDARKRQVADQTITRGNAGLVRSQMERLPVRVIRGHEEKSEHAPTEGYRYDGLYRVVRHWFKTRADGFRVLQFRLEKITEAETLPDLPQDIDVGDLGSQSTSDGLVSRTERVTQRLNRKVSVVRNIKKWHNDICQVCDTTIELPGGPASEVAHIQGLGEPHNGPDREENALCLCPNDHLRFDYGAIYLNDDLKVIDAKTGQAIGALRTHPKHSIDLRYVRQHRSYWTK